MLEELDLWEDRVTKTRRRSHMCGRAQSVKISGAPGSCPGMDSALTVA